MALSPISPQELFLQPISSDVDPGQEKNPVRRQPDTGIQALIRPEILTASTDRTSCEKWQISCFYFTTPKV